MSPERKKQLKEFIESLNKQEQIWMNGFLDALLNETNSPEPGAGKPVAADNEEQDGRRACPR